MVHGPYPVVGDRVMACRWLESEGGEGYSAHCMVPIPTFALPWDWAGEGERIFYNAYSIP